MDPAKAEAEPAPEEADEERVAMVARETRLQRDAVAALRAVLAHTRALAVDARGDETVEAHDAQPAGPQRPRGAAVRSLRP